MRQYLEQSVYDAAIERLDFIFAYFTEEYFHG
jgi:predicted phosphoadenosine phosphosulfate sulfurtransferase